MNDNKQLKLLTRTDKSGNKSIVIYDTLADKYYNVSESDVEHIFDDNNELLSADVIRKYFNFKDPEWRKTHQPKPYYAKKVNLKDQMQKQQSEAYNQLLKSQMAIMFKSVGVTMDDIIRFNTKPTIATINQFSVNSNVRDELVKKYKEIEAQYKSSFKKNDTLGNILEDLYNANKNKPTDDGTAKLAVIETIQDSLQHLDEEEDKNAKLNVVNNCINKLQSLPADLSTNTLKKQCLTIRSKLLKDDENVVDIIEEFNEIADNTKKKIEDAMTPLEDLATYVGKNENNIEHVKDIKMPGSMSEFPQQYKRFINWDTLNFRKLMNLINIAKENDNVIQNSGYDIIVDSLGNNKFDLVFKSDQGESSKYHVELDPDNTFEDKLSKALVELNGNSLSNFDVDAYNNDINSIKRFDQFKVTSGNDKFESVKADYTIGKLPKNLQDIFKNFVRTDNQNKPIPADIDLEDYRKFHDTFINIADHDYIDYEDPYNLSIPYSEKEKSDPQVYLRPNVNDMKDMPDLSWIKVPLKVLENYPHGTTYDQIKHHEVNKINTKQTHSNTTLENYDNKSKPIADRVQADLEPGRIVRIDTNEDTKIKEYKKLYDKMTPEQYLEYSKENVPLYHINLANKKSKNKSDVDKLNKHLRDLAFKATDLAITAAEAEDKKNTTHTADLMKQQLQNIIDKKAWVYDPNRMQKLKTKSKPIYDEYHSQAYQYFNPSTYLNLNMPSRGISTGGNWTSDTLSRLDSLYNRIFKSAGYIAGNWTSDTLSRLDSLYNRVMSSSGVCGTPGGNWSSDTLSRLDSLYNRVMA